MARKPNFLEKKDVAIISFAEVKNERRSGKTPYELAADVAAQLFRKTKFKPSDIDGFVCAMAVGEAGVPFWSNNVSEYLGLAVNWLHATDYGGASSLANISRAAMAIQSSLCETVMMLAADSPTSGRGGAVGGFRAEFQNPTGLLGAPGAFGLMMNHYADRYELDYRGLGALAVAQRNGAVANPNAYENFRQKITVDDYLNARMIAAPLRLLDSVMPVDGGSGLILTSTARARRLGFKKRVYPVAYAELTGLNVADQLPDMLETGHGVVGPKVLKQLDLKPADIDMYHPYDDFLFAVMLKLEQIGFCKQGQGSQFLRELDMGPKGTLPINTGGGQISCGQPGFAGGLLNIVEAVRQLMGEAGRRQVPKPRNTLLTGIGVIPYGRNWGTSNAMVMVN